MKKKTNQNNGIHKEKHIGWKLELTGVIVLAIILCICVFVFRPGFYKQELAVSGSSVQKTTDIPEYSGNLYVEINDNQPSFSEKDLTKEAFEQYSDLDDLGRCGPAFANVCPETLPKEERGPIGEVEPSGWQLANYHNLIDGNYLYNRCHLIAFSLSGENANEKNLITGTRYMNAQGMQPFELQVLDYVRATGNHVLYRVTPIFTGDNLLADGVEMEAFSVEDQGKGICFHIFTYNVQPGVIIDYKTGDNKLDPDYGWEEKAENVPEKDYVSQEKAENKDDNPVDSGEKKSDSKDNPGEKKSDSKDNPVDSGEKKSDSKDNPGEKVSDSKDNPGEKKSDSKDDSGEKKSDSKDDPGEKVSDSKDNPDGASSETNDTERTFILNTNTRRFHNPSCDSVLDIKEKNKGISTKSREELIEEGYQPCGNCKP